MKRFIHLLLALLIVASGMHVSVISHYCGGELAQTKLAFDQHAAGCGMENEQPKASSGMEWQVPACCANTVSVYKTDGFYQLSSTFYKKHTEFAPNVFVVPTDSYRTQLISNQQLLTLIHPPGTLPFGIKPETLCVFRI